MPLDLQWMCTTDRQIAAVILTNCYLRRMRRKPCVAALTPQRGKNSLLSTFTLSEGTPRVFMIGRHGCIGKRLPVMAVLDHARK
jgi:hypothetical protein